MNIGLFGGSFDPIHRGHLALAEAAAERCDLRQVLFVPANIPPHKQNQPLTAFIHRFAMIALATQDEKRFKPSLLEAPEFAAASVETDGAKRQVTQQVKQRVAQEVKHKDKDRTKEQAKDQDERSPGVNYSIDTVRLIKKSLKKSDRLFFLIGVDAFRDVGKWREARALLAECDFIVASRPGYSLQDVAESLPAEVRPSDAVTRPFKKQPATGDLVLPGVTLHLLEGVNQSVSATTIRTAAAEGKPLARWLDPRVAEYIKKNDLYRKKAA